MVGGGGGVELAVVCGRRVASVRVRVKLGEEMRGANCLVVSVNRRDMGRDVLYSVDSLR
jgi:enoyl-CoA hydratase/carnithine racemase